MNIGAWLPSLRRCRRAQRTRSPRTVEIYTDAVGQFANYLEEIDGPALVDAGRAENRAVCGADPGAMSGA